MSRLQQLLGTLSWQLAQFSLAWQLWLTDLKELQMTAELATIAACTVGRSEAGPRRLSSSALHSPELGAVCRDKVRNWSARWCVIANSAYDGGVDSHGGTPSSSDTSDAAGPSSTKQPWSTRTTYEDKSTLCHAAAHRVCFGTAHLNLPRPEIDMAKPSAINLTVGGVLPRQLAFRRHRGRCERTQERPFWNRPESHSLSASRNTEKAYRSMTRHAAICWLAISALALASCKQQEQPRNCLGEILDPAHLPQGTVTLHWQPSLKRSDGSSFDDLLGYRIFYGVRADDLRCQLEIRNRSATSATITGLSPGIWHFAVVSFDSGFVESQHSDVVSKQIK